MSLQVTTRIYWFTVLLFVVAMFARHLAVGVAFPIPWPDESLFLWPAIAFAKSTALFSPELNPHRDVFWMPPGYAIIIGTLFKITGASLVIARWFAFAYVA